jgi:hypothetical protein
MANNSETDWDEASPAGSDARNKGDDEIRYLRASVRARLAKEHTSPATASVGGEHTAGSAKAYYQTSDPTLRPDATTALSAGDAGRLLYRSDTSALKVYTGSAWSAVGASSGASFAVLNDTKAVNTAGGSFTSGAWRTRTLNTEVADPASIVSLASNQFTLAAGTYYVRASAPAMRVNSHQARLRNITDSTTTIAGRPMYSAFGGAYASSDSIVEGIFTIAGSKVFELQHQCETTSSSSSGLGQPGNFAESNIYSSVLIVKVA